MPALCTRLAGIRRAPPDRARALVPCLVACLAACLVWAGLASGEDAATAGRAADRPPPVDVSAADLMASARSEVRVIARENHEIEEYRVGSNVYKIKVKPRNAPPYYLIDEDGSGNLQWRRGPELERDNVPHWAIFRW